MNTVHTLFQKLSQATIGRLSREISQEAPRAGLTYVDERGRTEPITLTLRPRVIPANRRNRLWKSVLVLDGAFRKIASLYFKNRALIPLFPFSPQELDWISLMQEPGYRPGEIVSRWDANTTFGDQDWKEGSSFFEVNGVGVGGLWYGPACAEVSLKRVIPKLQKIEPHFRPFSDHDMRELLLDVLLSQRRRIGRTRNAMAFVMEKASGSNYIEFERLAGLFRTRGYPSVVVEPTDFRLKDDELLAKGRKIDILYRDTTLSELCLLEEKGNDLRPLREAFRRGQVVSSFEGEFDHKSAFEVFSCPEFASLFSSREREVFRRYILWTRLVRERRTADFRGRSVDLIPFALKNQSELVLKPNRLYGGQGVVFGKDLQKSVWRKKISQALGEPGEWVVQRTGKLRMKRFFRPHQGGAREKDLYVVSGFFATKKGMGIVGRMSERTVVNVARRGGLTPILLTR